MAPRLSETTVAAPRTSFLRASVNAVRGLAFGRDDAAKIGNATRKLRDDYADAFGDVPALHGEMAATHRKTGGVGCVGEQRPSTRDDIARHFGDGK